MSLTIIFTESLRESVQITLIIFFLMVVIELFVLKYQERLITFTQGKLQLLIASFFGFIPGDIGTFAMDSLYMAGLLGFGGIVAVMVASSGDEAFLMLSMAAKGDLSWTLVLGLFSLLFLLGVVSGVIANRFAKKMRLCEKCRIEKHKHEFQLGHFFKAHILNHIVKKHLWQVFLWVFAALFALKAAEPFLAPETLFSGVNAWYLLIIAVLVGILPLSGPNTFLVVMFSQGVIPFSILLANSIVQDGHGLLPIMGFSMDDAVKIKAFNLLFGLVISAVLLALGV